MKIISERRSRTDGNALLSAIVDYNGRLFKISETSPTKLYVWSGFNGWLYIDHGDRKDTTQESIDQFLPIMKAYTGEKHSKYPYPSTDNPCSVSYAYNLAADVIRASDLKKENET
jgi:hypothetical protein